MLKSKREQMVTQANFVMKPVVLWQLFYNKNQRFSFISVFLGRMVKQNSMQEPVVGQGDICFSDLQVTRDAFSDRFHLLAHRAARLVPKWFSQDPLWVTQDKKKGVKS